MGEEERLKEWAKPIKNDYDSTSFGGRTIHIHRLIWLKAHNFEKIPRGFVIHHINGNKKDNRIENLELLSEGEHRRKHLPVWNKLPTLTELKGRALSYVCEYVQSGI